MFAMVVQPFFDSIDPNRKSDWHRQRWPVVKSLHCLILQNIRTAGAGHPAHSHYETLERINDYTANYHHGEDARGAAEPVLDPTELMGYVNTTLRTVNALPA